jgi:hypothetical protein
MSSSLQVCIGGGLWQAGVIVHVGAGQGDHRRTNTVATGEVCRLHPKPAAAARVIQVLSRELVHWLAPRHAIIT